ncbi:hypothetical protein [Bradyrhizobium manausense]|uniref:Uncharacterized protein n=1 Tax=Bradyrhizobium manausense TaxID=989370 RepID=A0A0R3D861_9BRAD|nr:hypothetical protein [Bradyrhizobium manausense]KRQ06217.1 hypothetical protein AOQ71_26855 [Bradyrhizobium manausense]
MSQQDARKNYIGIVSEAEEERIADTVLRARSLVMRDLFGRLAAALGRPRKGAPGHTTSN